MRSTFYFKNEDWQHHLSMMLEYIKSDFEKSDINKYLTPDSVYAFLDSFLKNLDFEKNFYFSNDYSFEKRIYLNDGLGFSIPFNIRYDLDRRIQQSALIPMDTYGDRELTNSLLSNIGALVAEQLNKECYGDSYVITDPAFYVQFDSSYSYKITVTLKHNQCPIMNKVVWDKSYIDSNLISYGQIS